MKSLRRAATVADWQPHPLDARVTRHPRTHTLTRTYRVAYTYILYIAPRLPRNGYHVCRGARSRREHIDTRTAAG